jgi:hypothetical protein
LCDADNRESKLQRLDQSTVSAGTKVSRGCDAGVSPVSHNSTSPLLYGKHRSSDTTKLIAAIAKNTRLAAIAMITYILLPCHG